MKEKRHKIKTLQDILRAVNADNAENFLNDFKSFIDIWAGTRGLIEIANPESPRDDNQIRDLRLDRRRQE